MEAIAKISAVNGWILATLGLLCVFFALTLLLGLIVLLVTYTTRREERVAVTNAPVPQGMRVLDETSLYGDGEVLSKDYKSFLNSLKRK